MKLCMGCMNEIEDHISTCPYCGFNETTLRQESYYLDPGTIIGGKYIVGKVLKYGGHTISYLGMDAEINQKIIIKEYLPSDFSTRAEGDREITIYSGDAKEQFEEGLTNFLNEANHIQQLTQLEGIAKVYDCVVENDTGYVISEYIEGRTLQEVLVEGKIYSPEEAKGFISQILKGLSQIHAQGVIHCDISPETILVTKEGQPKLFDFGATKYVTTVNSKSLAIILKQGYAPEEMYRSRGKRGAYTDVYALAAVMYRMITGKVPQESVERALIDELREPSKLGVKIPENLEHALMNALNVYQSDRTASAEKFLQELNSASVKRIRVKKKKNETGKFPIWAKGLVAVLVCSAIVGGVLWYKNLSMNNGPTGDSSVKMIDLKDMSIEEAKKKIAEINKENGYEIKLDTEAFIFDAEKNGLLSSDQSVKKGVDLSDKKALKDTSLTCDKNGKVEGTITCTRYSSEQIHYRELSSMGSAYAMARKLEIDRDSKDVFTPEENEAKNYYDLKELVSAGEVISAKELKNAENAEKVIEVKGLQIVYYTSSFFYWEKLPDFEGLDLTKLKNYDLYRKKDEKHNKKTGKKMSLQASNLVAKDAENGYYTFSSSYPKNTIIKQTVAAGKKLATCDRKVLSEDYLLYAIYQQLSWQGTGQTVANRIKWGSHIKVKYSSGDKNKNQPVVEEPVVQDENGRIIKCFSKNQKLTVTIKTAVPSTPAPTPTQDVVPDNNQKNNNTIPKKKKDQNDYAF